MRLYPINNPAKTVRKIRIAMLLHSICNGIPFMRLAPLKLASWHLTVQLCRDTLGFTGHARGGSVVLVTGAFLAAVAFYGFGSYQVTFWVFVVLIAQTHYRPSKRLCRVNYS